MQVLKCGQFTPEILSVEIILDIVKVEKKKNAFCKRILFNIKNIKYNIKIK